MKHCKRRGASLIELLVVITMISAMMMVTGPLFYRLFQVDQVSARAALVEITTARLAIQYRLDVHAAQATTRTVDAETGRPSLELRSESQPRIVYTGGADEVRREVIGADGPTARETYRLPACRIEFPEPAAATEETPSKSPLPQLVTLVVDRPHSLLSGSNQPGRSRNLTLDAELGRDHRLTTPAPPAAAKPSEESK